MIEKTYRSNICKVWTLKRQDEIFAEKMNGIETVDYIDTLNEAERRAHKKLLPNREILLRKTTRQAKERVSFASFAVAASTAEEFAVVLSRALDRCAILRDLNADMEVKGRKEWTKAFEVFAEAKRKIGETEIGRAGGLRSAIVRGAKLLKAVEGCRAEWPLYNFTSEELAKKWGVSVAGLKSKLGSRKQARKEHLAAQRRKEKRLAKKSASSLS